MENSELSRYLRNLSSIVDEYYNRDMSMIIGEIISVIYSECKAENYEPIYDKKEIEEIEELFKPIIYHLKAESAISKAQEHLADFRSGKIAGVLV